MQTADNKYRTREAERFKWTITGREPVIANDCHVATSLPLHGSDSRSLPMVLSLSHEKIGRGVAAAVNLRILATPARIEPNRFVRGRCSISLADRRA